MKAASASPLKTTHFLTLHAPVEGKPFVAGKGNYGVRQIFAVPDGGWVDGLIKGKLVSPSGDWMRLSDKGIATLDVRTAILTDDDEPATIYVQYFGKIQFSAEIGNHAHEVVFSSCAFLWLITPRCLCHRGRGARLVGGFYVFFLPL